MGWDKSTDIKIMSQSLSVAWVSRLWKAEKLRRHYQYLSSTMWWSKILIRCKYNYKQLEVPEFYKRIFLYAKYIFVNKHAKEIIWNIKDILIAGKSICYKVGYTNGIIFLQ